MMSVEIQKEQIILYFEWLEKQLTEIVDFMKSLMLDHLSNFTSQILYNRFG